MTERSPGDDTAALSGQIGAHRTTAQPEQIGEYRILEKLGEGAMGIVYLAEQKVPVRRRVALKVVKLGVDSRQVIARFEFERQALAVMNHESIAKVFDAGTTEHGQPYFVMELVEGAPITRYCDEHRLPLHARIALFRQVCAGVQHAHQKGVLHRDLKPGNILVGRKGDDHVAKIIDFGVARATDHQLVEHTIHTEQGQIVGTPEYMSPEQAGGTALDLDTRTDIYSLGIVLYEILSGALPFSPAELRRAGLFEMQRIIREVDPARPSAKASDAETAGPAATRRATTVKELFRVLRRDLDWVVMTAIAKEPERRYASAAALSEDLGRFLEGAPIVARPPSARYTLARFVRRHRVQVAAVLAVFLVAVLGFVVSAAFAVQAQKSATDFANLLVGAEIDALEYRAAGAYPPGPATRAELDGLVAIAERLLTTVPTQQAVLAGLRQGHELEAAVARPSARGPHFDEERAAQLAAEIAFLRGQLPDPRLSEAGRAAGEREIAALRAELEELHATIEASNRVAIPVERDQFLYDRLEQQVRRLRRVQQELLPDLRFRAEWAQLLQAPFIDEHGDPWARAIAAIGADPRFAGLALEPQVGLVPLGPDPRSGLWEFVHAMSGTGPLRREHDHVLELGAEHGIVFVLLPRGQVRMGDVDDMPAAERAQLRVVQVEPFFLAKYELTRVQWQRLARDQRGLRLHDGGILDLRNRHDETNKPANAVTCSMCEQLLAQYGLELPSEVQWEYACKAGTASRWYTGNNLTTLVGHANVCDLTASAAQHAVGVVPAPFEDGFVGLAPAIALAANPFGLHQMLGNVNEWCADAYSHQNTKRALRGGSFLGNQNSATSTAKDVTVALDAARESGLRPARRVTGR